MSESSKKEGIKTSAIHPSAKAQGFLASEDKGKSLGSGASGWCNVKLLSQKLFAQQSQAKEN
jgi:hypothetical protein